MKVALLGKSGMLGSAFSKLFSTDKNFELFAFDKDELDITDYDFVHTVFKQIKPDVVINCAAIADVDLCERDRKLAYEVNSKAPGEVARICRIMGALFIHFSTDYVFDGKNPAGYKEADPTNPINYYGETKLRGEIHIAENNPNHYIVRTSWLFGPNGKNFVNTVIESAQNGETIKLAKDLIGCPTFTEDLAKAVTELFLIHERRKYPYGIYHLVNDGHTSRLDFGKEMFALAGLNPQIQEINSEDLPRPATRPKNSILLNTKTKPLRSFSEALKVYVDLIKK